jgi:hypothetical protein
MNEETGNLDAVLHRIGLPPLNQMNETQKQELRAAIKQTELSSLDEQLKALRLKGKSAPKVRRFELSDSERAALRQWQKLPFENARRLEEFENALNTRNKQNRERARLLGQSKKLRAAILEVLNKELTANAKLKTEDAWRKLSDSDFSTTLRIGPDDYEIYGDSSKQLIQRRLPDGEPKAIGRRTFEKYMTLARHPSIQSTSRNTQ